ncbi:unnamed protein product [Heligmosomoides polygyrus]|uniref:Secreted peptide n=1 Tax=Heligmosomoides polygyrus TaxID=6339 RepID=A0A183FHJ3_HELPZ|nr:unnamed protein product [Heligmosomoides polygyrus]
MHTIMIVVVGVCVIVAAAESAINSRSRRTTVAVVTVAAAAATAWRVERTAARLHSSRGLHGVTTRERWRGTSTFAEESKAS